MSEHWFHEFCVNMILEFALVFIERNWTIRYWFKHITRFRGCIGTQGAAVGTLYGGAQT